MTEKKTGYPIYTAYADFNFKFERKIYSAKRGETFVLPDAFIEVPNDPGVPGLKFQYPKYMVTVSDQGETEIEIPHYMILPLTK